MTRKNHDSRFDSLETIGVDLQEKRLSRGIGLEEVSAATGISTSVLQALENGEREGLPAEVYIKAFYKKYSDYLGIDSAEIGAQYPQKVLSKKRIGRKFDFSTVITLKGREEHPLVETLRKLFLPLAILILAVLLYLVYKTYMAPYNPLGFFQGHNPSVDVPLSINPSGLFC